MQVCVVKSGQEQFPAGIDHFGLRTSPRINLRLRADRHDAIADHSHRFGPRMLIIYGVNRSVRYDQGCPRFWLSVRIQRGHDHQETKCKRIFHNRVMNPETFTLVETCPVIS